MAITGITRSNGSIWKATEAIYNHKPKHAKAHGIKRPDTRNIVAVLTGIFVVVVIISMLMK